MTTLTKNANATITCFPIDIWKSLSRKFGNSLPKKFRFCNDHWCKA